MKEIVVFFVFLLLELTQGMPKIDSEIQFGEKCGVFGVCGSALDTSRLTYFGLWSLQHRGQESSGICTTDGKKFRIHKGLGLVANVYSERDLNRLKGNISIGHNRYATSGGGKIKFAQPIYDEDNQISLAHNGNLPSVKKLKAFLKDKGINTVGQNDSGLMHKVVQYHLIKGFSLKNALKECFPLFTGAFALVLMTKNKLVGLRDGYGIRPLSIGKLDGGYVLSSETCALNTIGAKFVRDVKPGEMVIISKKGIESVQLTKGEERLDVFEYVYFARPDSDLLGVSVYEARKRMGIELYNQNKIKADIIIPVPDSAVPAAIGYSLESGIPLEHALVKNRYIHRTFIKPTQRLRENSVKLKLNPIKSIIKGKSVILVDDSIVRGTTSKNLVKLVKDAGAKEVHMVVSSPPVKFPDFYGIDTPDQSELIGANKNIEQTRKYIGATSLTYLSLDRLLKAVNLPKVKLTTACFTGEYPVDIGEKNLKKISY